MRRAIVRQCAQMFDVPAQDILSHSRRGHLTLPRFAVYKALRMRGRSWSEIGRIMYRDRKTIAYGIRRAEWHMARDANYAAKVITLALTMPFYPWVSPKA